MPDTPPNEGTQLKLKSRYEGENVLTNAKFEVKVPSLISRYDRSKDYHH